MRLEFVGVLVSFSAALFAVVGRGQSWMQADNAGLSISYSLSVNGLLNGLLWITSELESNVVAVERIQEYSEAPQEVSNFSIFFQGREPEFCNNCLSRKKLSYSLYLLLNVFFQKLQK